MCVCVCVCVCVCFHRSSLTTKCPISLQLLNLPSISPFVQSTSDTQNYCIAGATVAAVALYVDSNATVKTPLGATTSVEDLIQWVDIFSAATKSGDGDDHEALVEDDHEAEQDADDDNHEAEEEHSLSSIIKIPIAGFVSSSSSASSPSSSAFHAHAYAYSLDVPMWLDAYGAISAPGNMGLLADAADRKAVQAKLKASNESSAAAFVDALCPFDNACSGNMDKQVNEKYAAARKVLLQVAVPAVWSDGAWRAVIKHSWTPMGDVPDTEGERCSGKGDRNPWEPAFGVNGSQPLLSNSPQFDTHTCGSPLVQGKGHVHPTVGRYCRKGENIGSGYLHFDTIGASLLTVFVSATLEGWVGVMYALQDTWGFGFVPVLFFLMIVLFINSFMFQLTLTVVAEKYEDIAAEKEGTLYNTRRTILRTLHISEGM